MENSQPSPAPHELQPVVVSGWQRVESGWQRLEEPKSEAPLVELADSASAHPVRPEFTRSENGSWERTLDTQVYASGNEREKTQYDKNRELLAESDGGVLLLSAYDAAVKAYPRLTDILIVPYDDEQLRGAKGSAFARHADKSPSGRHEIHVRLGNLDQSLDLMDQTLNDVPGLREMVSEKLLLADPSELTAMQLHTFVMLHEMGHLVEFMEHDGRMPELRERMKREKEALPLGNIATSAVIDPDSPGGKYVRENWEAIQVKFGVASIAELAEMKNDAHRNMTSEAYADNFAADVLVNEPELFDQLGSKDLTKYREFQVAA